MIYTELTKKALIISFNAHKDQVDKSGVPYVYHPFHVAEQMDDEYSTCVALLHDVVEDTCITLNDLSEKGFPTEIIDALALMTHDDNTEYMDYVRTLKDNPIARKVKMADLTHNSDLSRLDVIDDKALDRIKIYQQAMLILQKAERQSEIKTREAWVTSCCNKTVPVEYAYCPSCGKTIKDAKKSEMKYVLDQTLSFCQRCGKVLEIYGDYCGYCGNKSFIPNKE